MSRSAPDTTELAPGPRTPRSGGHSRDKPGAIARRTLVAACLSGFLFQIDLTALSAALPDLARSLDVGSGDQAWVIDVYSLALILALPLAGPLADRYGRKSLFVGGATLFGVSSALCAAATTPAGLLAWRVAQGVAAAAMTSSASALLAAAYPGEGRARAFGIWGTVIGASMVAGPPVGALIAALAGWPWVFWINVPLCCALVLLVTRIAPDQPSASLRAPVDWIGPLALAATIGSLAYTLLAARSPGPSPISGLALCLAALALFVAVERRHAAPAFDFALFGSSRFVAMCLVPIAGSIGYWALLVHLAQMARGPMKLDPTLTGVLLTALTVPMLLLPAWGARLAVRIPARWFFPGGLAVVGGADLLLALAARDLGGSSSIWLVAAALLLGGCGCAVFNAQIAAAAVSAVPPDRAATAAAICVTMRQIGFAFGIALIGAVLKQGHGGAYPLAFATVAACTLFLAAVVLMLLRRPDHPLQGQPK